MKQIDVLYIENLFHEYHEVINNINNIKEIISGPFENLSEEDLEFAERYFKKLDKDISFALKNNAKKLKRAIKYYKRLK